MASRTTILTLDHQYKGAKSIPWGETRVIKPVVIEDYVWVGMNTAILPGVTIGEGAIVGLGTVVTKDVPPRAIVVGNPARVVGYRDEKQYDSMKAEGAIRSPIDPCGHLWISPEIGRKYGELLREVGYDLEVHGGNSDRGDVASRP